MLAPIALAAIITAATAACSESEEFVPPWNAEVDAAVRDVEAGETERAIGQLVPLAEAGNVDAQHILGSIHEHGIGTAEDYCRALHWYRQSAAQDDTRGLIGLAGLYQLGLCVRKDYREAARYYKRAGDLGDTEAYAVYGALHIDVSGRIYNKRMAFSWANRAWKNIDDEDSMTGVLTATLLGYLYNEGLGVSVNRRKARGLYSLAAEHGFSAAQYGLGIYLANASDDEAERDEGYAWIFAAAYQGHEHAAEKRDHLASRLPESRIDDLNNRARILIRNFAEDPKTRLARADHGRVPGRGVGVVGASVSCG